MYPHTLRAARSCSGVKGLGLALGRIGGTRAAAAAGGWRSVSATSAANEPVPGDQGVAMEHPKQQAQPQVPLQDAAANNKRDDKHKTLGDVMSHSFGEGYATRCEEEGFGVVYGKYDPDEDRGADVHPSHPEYDKLQGSEVKEKEKGRHLRDEKHAAA